MSILIDVFSKFRALFGGCNVQRGAISQMMVQTVWKDHGFRLTFIGMSQYYKGDSPSYVFPGSLLLKVL